MGNLLQSIFSSSSHKKSFTTATGTPPEQGSVKKTWTKKKNSLQPTIDVTPATIESPKRLTDADFRSAAIPADSPFKRDFGPPSHQVLVPLEKYRPRRSNVRRSSRQNQAKSAGQTTDSRDRLAFTPDPIKDDQNETNVEEPTTTTTTTATTTPEQPKLAEPVSPSPEPEVDTLDPAERNKVTRTKLTHLLEKQRRQPPPLLNNSRKYQSVFEPSLDYFNSNNNNDHDHDDQQENGVELAPNDNHTTTADPEPNAVGSVASESAMLRRPRKALPQGNAMLIDELKKRQSHFAFDIHHHSYSASTNEPDPHLVPNDSNNNEDRSVAAM